MENYYYLNQKTEIPPNQDKLFFQFNKNNQYQNNFFRVDYNMNKQKGRIYNINNKKEIHFTNRAKENEMPINGPKMLTMNFPPGFMTTDITNNNNNSRKNASHEKNIYLQQNMANNMELNEIGSDSEKIFSNTVKKGFQDYNTNKDKENLYKDKKLEKKNLDNFGQNQISIKLNNNDNINNLHKKNIFYTGSGTSVTGFNSTGNTGYIRSETELNSGRGGNSSTEKEKEKNYEVILSHIRTEGSDFDSHKNANNYKSNLNPNMPFSIYINDHQNNKLSSKLIYEQNLESDINNNYSSNNSNNSKDKFSKNNSFVQKNFNPSNSNKLVFNPSSITNQRMIKKGSDSELFPSSINHLYIGNTKYKNLNKPFNFCNNMNDNFYKKNDNFYHYNKSENNSKLSPSQEKNSKNSNSQSRDKNHIKTQTDFEKKSRPNYYEFLINELENKNPPNPKFNINSAAEYNIEVLKNFVTKKKIENLEFGITYKIYNGYKFFFNVPNGQIYILKENNINSGNDIFNEIKEWNKKYENDSIYLKIYEQEIITEQKQTFVMQYPTGGESLNDLINSVGFYDQNILFDIVTKIYKAIIKIKVDKNNENYKNVPFCLCDIFVNLNEHIKIIPPIIRKMNTNSNNNKKINTQSGIGKTCKCKSNLTLLKIIFNINKECISFFCLGFAIIQIITQNLIFELNSYKSICKKRTNKNMINLNSNISYKNNNINYTDKKCCLVHSLLDFEKRQLKGSEYLLFSHFLNLYPKSLLSFLHESTNFKNIIPSSSNEFLNLYDTNKNLNLSIKEILEITTLPKNECINFEVFLKEFEILLKERKINNSDYLRKINSNKVIQVLSRAFGMDKEKIMNNMMNKIEDNDNNNKDKNRFKEKNFFEDKNNLNFDNFSSYIIGNKNTNNNNININNIFNKQNIYQLHNYRSSENYEYENI